MQKIRGAEQFGTGSVMSILMRIAPPVMLAQLIQAMYNIVDSYFVGKFSDVGLTALSAVYPMQLLITALAVGTGSGVNALMAQRYARRDTNGADEVGGTGIFLAIISWAVFAVFAVAVLRPFARVSVQSEAAVEAVVIYGRIVCIGSLGSFLEGCFTKIHQAQGNMLLPTLAQVAGAVTNIILDPLLILGVGIFPEMGVAGAAIATIIWQFVSAVITGIHGRRRIPKPEALRRCIRPIYHFGFPSIFMQGLYVVYIMLLNVILSGFTDSALTVLGLYYKLQSFFFIPLFALDTCIVPKLSFNYSRGEYDRCRGTVRCTMYISLALMAIGVFCFEVLPAPLIKIFSQSTEVLTIGIPAFRIIGASFLPAVFSLTVPSIFQALGKAKESVFLSLLRQIICLVPIFWIMSFIGLGYTWIAFPAAELITTIGGGGMYLRELKNWKGR